MAGLLLPSAIAYAANAERILSHVASRAAADKSITQLNLSLEQSPDLDSTALDALAECDAALQKSGCQLLLARVKDQVHALLAQTTPELADKSRCFRSVVDAYNAATKGGGKE